MKRYFKGLNTLRAVAALVVILCHIELLKSRNHIKDSVDHSSFGFFPDGHIAVVLFFVISGFLITYLLVKEKEDTGKISFKFFYLRRILRIWPLYYVVLALSYLLINANYQWDSVLLCLFIFPNIAHAFDIGWPSSPQIWSIGVEEQFYLFWPILISWIPNKKMILYLMIFFLGYSILPYVILFLNARFVDSQTFGKATYMFFYGTKFNCMCIGSIFGFMCATNHQKLNFFYNKYIAYSAFFMSFILWFLKFDMKYFTDEFYSIIFGVMVLNLASNDNFKLNVDSKLFDFLGKISYGMYMYHWIVIVLVIRFIPYELFGNYSFYNIVLYATIISSTILISWISFNSFEKYFLNLKRKFET